MPNFARAITNAIKTVEQLVPTKGFTLCKYRLSSNFNCPATSPDGPLSPSSEDDLFEISRGKPPNLGSPSKRVLLFLDYHISTVTLLCTAEVLHLKFDTLTVPSVSILTADPAAEQT